MLHRSRHTVFRKSRFRRHVHTSHASVRFRLRAHALRKIEDIFNIMTELRAMMVWKLLVIGERER